MNVAPIQWPERLSQTLLRIHNRCPLSAYLYARHGGGPKTHAMDRGTLFHACAERLYVDLIREGETTLYHPGSGSEEELSQQTAAIVDEVRREHPELVISHDEADVVRICLYHMALGMDVSPEHVLAIERTFVLDLDCGWRVSVKADLISMPDRDLLQVDDYKTSLYVPGKEDWDTFQVKLGLLAAMQGWPADDRDANELHRARLLLTPRRFVGRELYPRRGLNSMGRMYENRREWSAIEMHEFRQDLEAMGAQITQEVVAWEFEARAGSHCNTCAAVWECPLTVQERDLQGAQSAEQAAALMGEAKRLDAHAKRYERAAKDFAKAHDQPLQVGDQRFEFVTTEHRELLKRGGRTDWEAVELALAEGRTIDDMTRIARRTAFKPTKGDQ